MYIHELFVSNTEDIVEVFDCYDSRYGNIFYKGKPVAHFYKENYTDILGLYSFIKELEKKKIDIKKASVLVYELETLRDYEANMSVMDFECAIDYTYKELLDNFKTDLVVAIEAAVAKAQAEHSYYQFITASSLSDYI